MKSSSLIVNVIALFGWYVVRCMTECTYSGLVCRHSGPWPCVLRENVCGHIALPANSSSSLYCQINLQILPLLLLNSITCKFHMSYNYLYIPVLANSTLIHTVRLLQNSVTCKFYAPLLSNSIVISRPSNSAPMHSILITNLAKLLACLCYNVL